MYTYHKEVTTGEKLLSAGEIANLFNLETINGIPNIKLVDAILRDYTDGMSDYEQLYYINQSYGYREKVYSADTYTQAVAKFLCRLLKKYPDAKLDSCDEQVFEFKLSDREYRFKIA